MRRQIRREIRLLRWWTLASTGALVALSMATLFGQGQVRGTRFDEISVERINVVEPDGRVRLVVANSARQADAVIDGKVVGAGQRRAGLAVIDRPETSLVRYAELAERRQAASTEAERAAVEKERASLPASAPRMFVGKDVEGRATLVLSDAQGRQRLLLAVDKEGRASIRFLDAAGKVVKEVVP